MKLNELAVTRPTQQIAKVFEGHFDQRVQIDSLNRKQLHNMYRQVRGVLSEVRSSPARHNSEKNPSYLKLMMMEQALAEKIYEDEMGNTNPTAGTPGAGMNPQQNAAMAAKQKQDDIKQMETDLEAKKKEVTDLQNQLNAAKTTVTVQEWRRRAQGHGYYLSEGEVQQAQVVLAAQDMVDKMQDMIEDSTEMQFKELPALVDSIKNQIGQEQAAQFNNDAQAALSGLVQNLQGSKQQLEQALGVVTGQAPTPGSDMGAAGGMGMPAAPGGDQGLAGPPPGEEQIDISATEPAEPGAAAPAAALGRGRR
jgi:fructose-specific phosphotransferase system component IIB